MDKWQVCRVQEAAEEIEVRFFSREPRRMHISFKLRALFEMEVRTSRADESGVASERHKRSRPPLKHRAEVRSRDASAR